MKNFKMLTTIGLIMLLFFPVLLISQAMAAKKEPKFKTKNPARYQTVVFDSIEVKKNIRFTTVTNEKGESQDLQVDIYTPAGDKDHKRPAILWIHGGGFRPGNDKTQSYIVTISREFAKRGYVSISTDYRVRENPRDNFPKTLQEAVDDCRTALNWVRQNAKTYGIDPNWIAIAGGSAGGMTGVSLAAIENSEAAQNNKRGIFAFIDLWGSPSPDRMVGELNAHFPPTVIIHGTQDQSVPFQNSEQLSAKLKALGIKHHLYPIPDGPHTPVKNMPEIIDESSKFLYGILTKKS